MGIGDVAGGFNEIDVEKDLDTLDMTGMPAPIANPANRWQDVKHQDLEAASAYVFRNYPGMDAKEVEFISRNVTDMWDRAPQFRTEFMESEKNQAAYGDREYMALQALADVSPEWLRPLFDAMDDVYLEINDGITRAEQITKRTDTQTFLWNDTARQGLSFEEKFKAGTGQLTLEAAREMFPDIPETEWAFLNEAHTLSGKDQMFKLWQGPNAQHLTIGVPDDGEIKLALVRLPKGTVIENVFDAQAAYLAAKHGYGGQLVATSKKLPGDQTAIGGMWEAIGDTKNAVSTVPVFKQGLKWIADQMEPNNINPDLTKEQIAALPKWAQGGIGKRREAVMQQARERTSDRGRFTEMMMSMEIPVRDEGMAGGIKTEPLIDPNQNVSGAQALEDLEGFTIAAEAAGFSGITNLEYEADTLYEALLVDEANRLPQDKILNTLLEGTFEVVEMWDGWWHSVLSFGADDVLGLGGMFASDAVDHLQGQELFNGVVQDSFNNGGPWLSDTLGLDGQNAFILDLFASVLNPVELFLFGGAGRHGIRMLDNISVNRFSAAVPRYFSQRQFRPVWRELARGNFDIIDEAWVVGLTERGRAKFAELAARGAAKVDDVAPRALSAADKVRLQGRLSEITRKAARTGDQSADELAEFGRITKELEEGVTTRGAPALTAKEVEAEVVKMWGEGSIVMPPTMEGISGRRMYNGVGGVLRAWKDVPSGSFRERMYRLFETASIKRSVNLSNIRPAVNDIVMVGLPGEKNAARRLAVRNKVNKALLDDELGRTEARRAALLGLESTRRRVAAALPDVHDPAVEVLRRESRIMADLGARIGRGGDEVEALQEQLTRSMDLFGRTYDNVAIQHRDAFQPAMAELREMRRQIGALMNPADKSHLGTVLDDVMEEVRLAIREEHPNFEWTDLGLDTIPKAGDPTTLNIDEFAKGLTDTEKAWLKDTGMFEATNTHLLPASPMDILGYMTDPKAYADILEGRKWMRTRDTFKFFSEALHKMWVFQLLMNPQTLARIGLDETLRFLEITGDLVGFGKSSFASLPFAGKVPFLKASDRALSTMTNEGFEYTLASGSKWAPITGHARWSERYINQGFVMNPQMQAALAGLDEFTVWYQQAGRMKSRMGLNMDAFVDDAARPAVKGGPVVFAPAQIDKGGKLDEVLPVVWRETDALNAGALAEFGRVSSPARLDVASDPALALGQGRNQGYVVEMSTKGLTGRPVVKPGVMPDNVREISLTGGIPKENIRSITVKAGATASKGEKIGFERITKGWATRTNADGSITYFAPSAAKPSAIKKWSVEELHNTVMKGYDNLLNQIKDPKRRKEFDEAVRGAAAKGEQLAMDEGWWRRLGITAPGIPSPKLLKEPGKAAVFGAFQGPQIRRGAIFMDSNYQTAKRMIEAAYTNGPDGNRILSKEALAKMYPNKSAVEISRAWREGSMNRLVREVIENQGWILPGTLDDMAWDFAKHNADRLMYNIGVKSEVGRKLKNVFPFASAQIDFVDYWARRLGQQSQLRLPLGSRTYGTVAPFNVQLMNRWGILSRQTRKAIDEANPELDPERKDYADTDNWMVNVVNDLLFVPTTAQNTITQVGFNIGPMATLPLNALVSLDLVDKETLTNWAGFLPGLDFIGRSENFWRMAPDLFIPHRGTATASQGLAAMEKIFAGSTWMKAVRRLAGEDALPPAMRFFFDDEASTLSKTDPDFRFGTGGVAANEDVLRGLEERALELGLDKDADNRFLANVPGSTHSNGDTGYAEHYSHFAEDLPSISRLAGIGPSEQLDEIVQMGKDWEVLNDLGKRDFVNNVNDYIFQNFKELSVDVKYDDEGKVAWQSPLTWFDQLILRNPELPWNIVGWKKVVGDVPEHLEKYVDARGHLQNYTIEIIEEFEERGLTELRTPQERTDAARGYNIRAARHALTEFLDTSGLGEVGNDGTDGTPGFEWMPVTNEAGPEDDEFVLRPFSYMLMNTSKYDDWEFTLTEKQVVELEQLIPILHYPRSPTPWTSGSTMPRVSSIATQTGLEIKEFIRDARELLDLTIDNFGRNEFLDSAAKPRSFRADDPQHQALGPGLTKTIEAIEDTMDDLGVEYMGDYPEPVKNLLKEEIGKSIAIFPELKRDFELFLQGQLGELNWTPNLPEFVSDGKNVWSGPSGDLVPVDGDTITIPMLGAPQPQNVRIIGINAPESNDPEGRQLAIDYMTDLLDTAEEITFIIYEPDLYGLATRHYREGGMVNYRVNVFMFADGIWIGDESLFTSSNERGVGIGGEPLNLLEIYNAGKKH